EIRERTPETRILALTVHKEEASMLEALQAGVSGYCVNDAPPEELVRAVRIIADGRAYLSSTVARTIVQGYVTGDRRTMCRSSWESLTSCEKDVLKLTAERRGNKDIADMLSMGVRDVLEIRRGLMSKLGLHSTSALTAFAIERGLVSQ
ncbi:MAG: response regulator transcription factor, partial [Pseudomonadota bacterium]